MNGKRIFAGLLVTGLTVMSGMQLYASALSNESIKTNVVYTATDSSAPASTSSEIETLYNQKCFEVLKNYFNITPDMLPAGAKFSIFVMNKDSLDKEEAHWSSLCDQEYSQKKFSEEEYNKRKLQLKNEYNAYRNQVQKLNHDIVSCQLLIPNNDDGLYYISFNADTKEPFFVSVPCDAKGWEIQKGVVDGKVTAPVSAESDAKKKANAIAFIKKNQLNGIQNPEFINMAGSTHNRLYFQDANDHSKMVLLFLDPATYNVYMFDYRVDANDMN